MYDIYVNIRNKRKELGMSQEELAKKVGYNDRSTIARIEKGEIDLPYTKIYAFADALGVTPSWLMGWDTPSGYEELDSENKGIIQGEIKQMLRSNTKESGAS